MKRTVTTRRYRGFTLVELLITLSISALLLGIAAPSFRDAMDNSRQSSVYNSLVGAMRQARSEAIKQSRPVSVCARANGVANICGGDWNNGWLIFTDGEATPGAFEGTETLLSVGKEPPQSINVSNRALLQNNAGSPIARPFIRFGPRGTSNWRGAGSYILCDGRGTDRALAFNVTLSGDVRKARRNDAHELLDAFGAQVTCP